MADCVPSWKQKVKYALITALSIAPALAVMLLSAAYNLTANAAGYGLTVRFPLLLGALTVFSLLASTVLGLVLRRRMIALLLAVLFWLSFFSYLCISLAGTSDPAEDAFFETVLMIFSLPVWSYMPIAEMFGNGAVGAALCLTALPAVLNTASAVFLSVSDRRREESRE
jgi:hypothetical protein